MNPYPSIDYNGGNLRLFVSLARSKLSLLKNYLYSRKSSIKAFPGGGGAYLFQTHLGGGNLFNLAKTMVSILHKELGKKWKSSLDLGGHAAEDQKLIRTSSC